MRKIATSCLWAAGRGSAHTRSATCSAPAGWARELVPGRTLAEVIAAGGTSPPGPITLADAVSIARQIAEALEAAHERGIVHRDLKPANVKITLDGVVKVLDFGLAKALAQETAPGGPAATLASAALTEEGLILGTARYMAPEQALGRPVDRRADIWAFGVVLFEMLTGRPLFRGETVAEIGWGGVYTVPAEGGTPTLLLPTDPKTDVEFNSVSALDDGRFIVTTFLRESQTYRTDLVSTGPDTQRTTLIADPEVTTVKADRRGALLFRRRGPNQGVWAAPFDGSRVDLGRTAVIAPRGTSFQADTTAVAGVVGPRDPDPGAGTGAAGRRLMGLDVARDGRLLTVRTVGESSPVLRRVLVQNWRAAIGR